MNEDYCLWMGDIDPRMDESIIKGLFQIYNVYPQAIKLIKDKETNKNRNYCFIYFKNIYEANNTLNRLRGKPIPNTSLSFKLNWANYHTTTTKTVYIGNLNPSVNDTTFFNFFKSKYKSVSKANVITENGESKRYGFVTFKKENDYRKCLIEMNGVFFEGTNIKVRECKKKDDDDGNKNGKNNKPKKNSLQSSRDKINTSNQLDLSNKNINSNDKKLNTNNLNSNGFLTILNSINKLNWISNANPINGVINGINHNKFVNVNNHNNWFNQNTFNDNHDTKNNVNPNNSINGNRYLKYIKDEIDSNRVNNDINNIDNINNSNNNYINKNNEINESKINKELKLEILEELDEITLKIKINESLNKMLEYYKESYLINGKRLVSKLILYLIFL